MTRALHIRNLSTCPDYLPLLAQWQQQQWGDAALEQRLQRLQSHLDAAAVPSSLVALVDGVPVGCISIVHYQRLAGDPGSVWLANLYVLPGHRTRGVGEQLLTAALQFAAARQLTPVNLYTTDKEVYYSRRGWRVIKRGWFRRQPAVVMRYTGTVGG